MHDIILDEDETFPGYTDEGADAIHQALIEQHLKPEADCNCGSNTQIAPIDFMSATEAELAEYRRMRKCPWHGRLLPDIETLLCDLRPDTVVRAGESQQRLKALQAHLEAAAQVYDQMGDLEQAHVEDQRMIPERSADVEHRQVEDWSALVAEQTGTQISVLDFQTSDLADHRPYALGRILDHALAAVRQAQSRPINPMIASVQTLGRTKNDAIRRAVCELLEIFERATGVQPIVSSSSYADDGIKGNVCQFTIACLAPVGLVLRTSLGRNILTAYTEWNQERMRRERTCREPSPQ